MDPEIAALQQRATDPKTRVSQLVREALGIAVRVQDKDMIEWLRSEMNGYKTMRDAPPYRWTRGTVRVWNAYVGWIPVAFRDPAEEERITKLATTQGVGALEALLGADTGRGPFGLEFPPFVAQQITGGEPYLSRPMVQVNRVAIDGVLDAVRNRILEWTHGHGVAATRREPPEKKGADLGQVVIEGPIVDSQVQIAGGSAVLVDIDGPIDISAAMQLAREVRKQLDSMSLSADDAKQVQADLASLEAQAQAPKPRLALVRSLVRGVGSILTSAGGTIAGELGKRLMGL